MITEYAFLSVEHDSPESLLLLSIRTFSFCCGTICQPPLSCHVRHNLDCHAQRAWNVGARARGLMQSTNLEPGVLSITSWRLPSVSPGAPSGVALSLGSVKPAKQFINLLDCVMCSCLALLKVVAHDSTHVPCYCYLAIPQCDRIGQATDFRESK